MKSLKFIVQNIIYSILGTILSFMLRFYNIPESGDIVESVMLQMLWNLIIIFVLITAGRMLAPYIKKIALKWDRKKAERYEKLLLAGLCLGLLLIAYLLMKSIDSSVSVLPF